MKKHSFILVYRSFIVILIYLNSTVNSDFLPVSVDELKDFIDLIKEDRSNNAAIAFALSRAKKGLTDVIPPENVRKSSVRSHFIFQSEKCMIYLNDEGDCKGVAVDDFNEASWTDRSRNTTYKNGSAENPAQAVLDALKEAIQNKMNSLRSATNTGKNSYVNIFSKPEKQKDAKHDSLAKLLARLNQPNEKGENPLIGLLPDSVKDQVAHVINEIKAGSSAHPVLRAAWWEGWLDALEKIKNKLNTEGLKIWGLTPPQLFDPKDVSRSHKDTCIKTCGKNKSCLKRCKSKLKVN